MSPTTPLSSIPVLSSSVADNYEFKFVGEGAANFVFEVLVPPGDEHRSLFQEYLLRVPKAETKAHSYVELQEYWETVVRPLFDPEDLVQHQLIKLEGKQLVSRLNTVLDEEEHARRADFRGSRVAVAEYGMLVEDMRQKHANDLTLEFKPKWLAQSPNAPASATRCRNCAREALKQHTKPNHHHSHHPKSPQQQQKTILCPLNFLTCATSPPALTNILTHLSTLSPPISPPISPQTTPPSQYARLTHWLQTNTLLPRLRTAQLANDDAGPLGVDDADADAHEPSFQLALAMTLRDCACFVRIPADSTRPVEAKLADLDKKNWEAKLGYWRDMERRLVEGGYYEGKGVEGVKRGGRYISW
ncbi:inositol pentakisphosphate 2-kinase [Parachaetomium inaequale]|uniref:Inositol-pentakisphosphate 2-kinase n=1 Tax=Parachaetomium inaequale TaxID=2588326 RepID=A0AAN6P903_9PEZI|nr:inositol pentakisphosphate 2-kinase [Parachaetomium inaequale]